MRTFVTAALVLALGAMLPLVDAGKKKTDEDEVKTGLEALQEFIGGWKGTASDKAKGFWTEKSSWSWRFKGKDRWMTFDLENSKLYKGGEVRFLDDKSIYQITVIDKHGSTASELWFRTTTVFKHTGGAWRVIHEHQSVPMMMDGSGLAAVDLKPA